jgi:hypothetical protein
MASGSGMAYRKRTFGRFLETKGSPLRRESRPMRTRRELRDLYEQGVNITQLLR